MGSDNFPVGPNCEAQYFTVLSRIVFTLYLKHAGVCWLMDLGRCVATVTLSRQSVCFVPFCVSVRVVVQNRLLFGRNGEKSYRNK